MYLFGQHLWTPGSRGTYDRIRDKFHYFNNVQHWDLWYIWLIIRVCDGHTINWKPADHRKLRLACNIGLALGLVLGLDLGWEFLVWVSMQSANVTCRLKTCIVLTFPVALTISQTKTTAWYAIFKRKRTNQKTGCNDSPDSQIQLYFTIIIATFRVGNSKIFRCGKHGLIQAT